MPAAGREMTPQDYADRLAKTPMRAHQLRAFLRSADLPAFALWHEQRTGKSKVIIDTAAYNYFNGKIDALLVVAWPSGVHRNWDSDECPAHLPLARAEFNAAVDLFCVDAGVAIDSDGTERRMMTAASDARRGSYASLVWRSAKAANRSYQQRLDALIAHPGLACLFVNAEALTTDACRVALKRFLDARRCLVAADESGFLKTPGAARTKVMLRIGVHRNAVFRRAMDGTPTDSGPFDFFTQYQFLDPKILGFGSFFAFKNYYAIFEDKVNHDTGVAYKELKEYRNLSIFRQRTARYCDRVLRADVSDAPPKVYAKRYFELSAEQRRVYRQVEDEMEATLADGREVSVSLVLTQYLRLQQVASNRWPPERVGAVCPGCIGEDPSDGGCGICGGLGFVETTIPPTVIDVARNPRLEALEVELRAWGDVPTVVWCRFRFEVDEVMSLAASLGRIAARYDGGLGDDAKLDRRRRFQAGEIGILAASPDAGQRGIKLSLAALMVFYTNGFSLIKRQQTEDRGEDLVKLYPTTIVDLVAEDTKDGVIVSALRAKKSVADVVMGDAPKEWV